MITSRSMACAAPALILVPCLASACVVPKPVGNGADATEDGGPDDPEVTSTGGGAAMDDTTSTDGGAATDEPEVTSTESGAATDGATGQTDDTAGETEGAEQHPDCMPPTGAALSLALTVDGVLYDPSMPPLDLLYTLAGACTVTSALGATLVLECPDMAGQTRELELLVDASPAVALPSAGATVHASYYLETDDLSAALSGWSLSLRDGSADGPLLLAINGAFALVLYGVDGLEGSYGPVDVCPHQEIDEQACRAYRRTWVAVDADGATLEAFDHSSVDVGDLRMVVGDAAFRTAAPDVGVCGGGGGGGGLGPGLGRFELVIGPPA